MSTRNTHMYWLLAVMIGALVLITDFSIACYFYDETQRIPFFVQAVFGTDWVMKLEFVCILALLVAGCEVSQ